MAKIPRVQQILDLSIETVNKMTAAELKKNVQILASAANKRLARLGSTEIGKVAPAYLSAAKRSYTGAAGGKFGTAGKSRNQLLNEYKAVKSFLQMKTSSVSAWKAVRKKSYERAGLPLTDDAEKEIMFWRLYRKIEELFPEMKTSEKYGSDETQTDLRRVMFGDAKAEIIADINERNLRDRKTVSFDGEDVSVKSLDKLKGDYVVDDQGVLWKLDLNYPEDILRLMELKVRAEYETESESENERDKRFREL